eukprot:5168943-Amphidinium_carterae.1
MAFIVRHPSTKLANTILLPTIIPSVIKRLRNVDKFDKTGFLQSKELQWTRLEKGRMFKDLKLRGVFWQELPFSASPPVQRQGSVTESSRDSPDENSYDMGEWTFHYAVKDMLGILPRVKELGVKQVTITTTPESTQIQLHRSQLF